MSSVIATIERAQMRRVPSFAPGDRVKVHFQVVEGTRSRVQIFEGVVIKRQGHGARETFTVRKQSFGVGVERMFPVHSPKIERIELAARGDVRRAKLYYLRDRVGKRALKLRDWGKMAATFVDLNAGLGGESYKGMRVVALESSKGQAQRMYPELEKNAQQMKAYRELPDSALFSAQWVRVPLPPSEFPGYKGERVACARCGEGVNFDRFVERGGERLCVACAGGGSLYYERL